MPTTAPFHQQVISVYRQAIANGYHISEVEQLLDQHIDRLQRAFVVETQNETQRATSVKNRVPAVVRFGAVVLPLVFVAVGLYLIGSAVVPIFSYARNSDEYAASPLVSPIVTTEILETTPLAIPQVAGVSTQSATGVTILESAFDYTNLSNWFGAAEPPQLANAAAQAQQVLEYRIDIPAIEVENAVVSVGGSDLSKSLIAYPGTALPGELGAPVVFGHSVLRQFYNPSEKNPRRYNSIFSTIMTLKAGDHIYVSVGDTKYTYVVQDKTEVKPEDVYILNQSYDARRIKLVTCTPEGTYLRRGVVTAELLGEST